MVPSGDTDGYSPTAEPLPEAAAWRVSVFIKLVVAGMGLALVYGFVMTHYFHKGYPYNTFLVGTDDCGMDFFNVNSYSYGLDPYPTLVPYPPFAMLLARLFASGFDYAAHGPFGARASLAGRVSCLLLLGGFCAFFVAAVYRTAGTGSRRGDLKLALALCASYPVLFLLDRGNYVTVAFACLFGFVHCYHRRPLLACLCLALAASLKIYPVLFLLLLAADRRWRDCAVVIGLTAVLNFGALLFFENGVLTNTYLFLRNLVAFSNGQGKAVVDGAWNLSLANLVRVPWALFFHSNPQRLLRIYPLVMLAVVGVTYYALRVERVFWKRVLLVTVAQVQLPGYTADYNLVYLVIPLLLYFRQAGPPRREDYFYLACAGLLFVPKNYYVLGIDWLHVLTLGAFVNPLLLLGLFLYVLRPRLTRYVLAGGCLVMLAGVAYSVRHPGGMPGAVPHPNLGMEGISGSWLVREGFTLTAPTDVLGPRPVICARGQNISTRYLGGRLPGVKATLVIPNQRRTTVPASLTADGGDYVLTVNLAGRKLPPQCPAEIRLSFDRWFVPKSIGLNEDPRELVIPTPHTLMLLPAPPRTGGGEVWPTGADAGS